MCNPEQQGENFCIVGNGFRVLFINTLDGFCVAGNPREKAAADPRHRQPVQILARAKFCVPFFPTQREDRDRDRPREWPAGQFPSVALQRISRVWTDLPEH